MEITLKSRCGTHYAKAKYEDGNVTILPGSRINQELAFTDMPMSIKALRENDEYVSPDGIVLKEVSFKSPTSAAQFITGRSVNGKIAWRIDDRISLKDFQQNDA